MKKITNLLALLFLTTSASFAQKSIPTPVEIMAGNERMYYNVSVTKPVVKNLVFSSVNSVSAEYDFNKSSTELVSSNSLTYKVHPNIGLGGGIQWHFLKGFVPNISSQFVYANPNFLFVVSPILDFMPWVTAEVVAIGEYKPKISNHLRLFTRLQALYAYDLDEINAHERSFYYFRLGLTHKRLTFGAATNLDYYGSKYFNRNNYGAFLRVNL